MKRLKWKRWLVFAMASATVCQAGMCTATDSLNLITQLATLQFLFPSFFGGVGGP